jgi:tight adherence protein C
MGEMSLLLVLSLAGIFLAVALGAGVVTSMVLSSASTERKRLFSATRVSSTIALPEVVSLSKGAKTTVTGWQKRADSLLASTGKSGERLRLKLMRAGLQNPLWKTLYTTIERIGPLVAAGAAYYYLEGNIAIFAGLLGAVVTFFGPGFYVDRRLAKRRREIENGLPDALDLLVVCIEAGSSLDQAMVKTADELTIAYPTLADELRILTAEIRAGKPRLEAFRALAQRTKVPDVRGLVNMLIQTDKFGTSIGQALRTHADVSRSKRRQRAEERAQKVGVKLVFPLVLCFFPAFYVVVLGPAVIHFIREFM